MYSAKDVARMLDLSVSQVRSYARAGFMEPERGPRGEYRFSFQDLVLLRTAKGLVAQRVPALRVKRALNRLRAKLPKGRPLSAVQIVARGDRVLVRHGRALWQPETGQSEFDFDVGELAERVAPHAGRALRAAQRRDTEMSADEWFALGADLEPATPEHARDAYRRALELDPFHVESRVNLGRLLHEAGHVRSAESHYRLALASAPANTTGLYNLGVALEDLGRDREAMQSYLAAIEADPEYADAYYNLARLLEKSGDTQAALRHLSTYRKLTEG
jgi:tetratricopeptide (TPR) repeat protein